MYAFWVRSKLFAGQAAVARQGHVTSSGRPQNLEAPPKATAISNRASTVAAAGPGGQAPDVAALTVAQQVEALLRMATSADRLSRMYEGAPVASGSARS